MSAMDAPTVIRTKRDGGRLSDDQIDWIVDAYTHGSVTDGQMAALLMAIFLRGMDRAEIARWTAAMIASGDRFDFTDLRGTDGRPLALVDKHPTGGVGDKLTIPLVPVVAACGAAIPQAAGRGLGHTGGTLDKLESIPGFTAALGTSVKQLETQGSFVKELTDVLTEGVGVLVDADLAEESANLQAVQTRQQLGIQALAIANQGPGAVLALFR